MALSRRTGQRFQANIWPGFVDAMTGLLLVLMFVLTIFMVVQFVLRETISGQETELDELSAEVAKLAQALGLEQGRAKGLETRVGELNATLESAQDEATRQASLIATLSAERAAQDAALAQARASITSFEAQVAGLLADRDAVRAQVAGLEAQQAELVSEQEALNLALASARSEIDAGVEAARLAAAKRDALEALVAGLERDKAGLEAQISEEEAARLVDAAAAEALRARLANADTELTAMTLALEQQRREAEETLTLLAAAQTASKDLDDRLLAALLAGDQSRAAYEAQLAEANEARANERAELEEQLSNMQAALAQVRGENDGLNQGTASLEQRLSAAQAALVAQKSAAEGRAEQARTERAELERRLAEALAERDAARETGALAGADREEVRKQLMAALAAKLAAEQSAEQRLTEAEARKVLLAAAQDALSGEEAKSAEAMRQQALLNQQVAALRGQLGSLQALLDDYKDRDVAAQVQLQSLGSDLNTALARAAAEERKRRQLEEAENARLEAERARLQAQTKDLEQYRSEFFGRVREVLGSREGVRIVGDRFVFSSEVLFPPGGARLSRQGQGEVAKIASILREVAGEIPTEIDWVIRVDGHTDNVPLSGAGEFSDNWELSQARALSVVRYMVSFLGIPPERLSANGFGQYQPIASGDSEEARAMNRRIELKFTEK